MILVTADGVQVQVADDKALLLLASGRYTNPTVQVEPDVKPAPVKRRRRATKTES